jgi:hypothetical protein
MTNSPPEDPKVRQTWVDDDGELLIWDGSAWVPYEDFIVFDPNTLYRDT